MLELEELHRTYRRLADNEPIRILIGERFYSASEIVPAPTFGAKIRRTLLTDIARQIADLQSPPPETPAPAMPAERIA